MTSKSLLIGMVLLGFQGVALAESGIRLPVKIAGEAEVLDGGTLIIGQFTIQIWGIEAPALNQTCFHNDDDEFWNCGEEAARALEAFIDGREVVCGTSYLKIEEPVLADCTRGDVDIGVWLVRNGWALDRPSQSEAAYAEEEEKARSEHAGIWRSLGFPWRWHQAKRSEKF